MSRSRILYLWVVSVLFGLASTACLRGEPPVPAEKTVWGERMASEAPLWAPLVADHWLMLTEDAKKSRWPKKKKSLEAAIARFPDSPYADDTAMAAACGIARWEGDLTQAAQRFRDIIERYPDGKSILYYWSPASDFQLDPQWRDWVPGLVGAAKRGPEMRRRLLRDPRHAAALAYFEHLEEHPRYTKDLAALYLVMVRFVRREPAQAVNDLRTFCDSNYRQMVEFDRADRQVSARLNGHFIRLLFRPTVYAHWLLMEALRKQGNIDEAIAVGVKAVEAVSGDGWYPRLNRRLGDLYREKSGELPSPQAEQQYRLALRGWLRRSESETRLVRAAGGTWENVPLTLARREILELKRRIRSAGGEIAEGTAEIERLKTIMEEPLPAKEPKPPQRQDSAVRLPLELSRAVGEDDVSTLASYAGQAQQEVSLAAIDALSTTPAGRAALARLVEGFGDRRRRAAVVALGRAGTADAISILKMLAERAQRPDVFSELIEAVVESMPEHEARRFCLEEAQKLAQDPDAKPEKLEFFLRGLRQDEDPPEVRVLRKVLRSTKNEKVRLRCVRILAHWITDASEIREDVFRILEGHLQDENAGVRAAVIRALGQSAEVRHVAVLVPALDDADSGVRRQAAEAVCELLGWKRLRRWQEQEEVDAWLRELKVTLRPVLKAMEDLDGAGRKSAED